AFDRAPDPARELLGRLGAGNDVPSLLLEDPQSERVSFDDLLAVHTTLPLPQMDLSQVGLDGWRDADSAGERLGQLGSPAQGAHVDGVDVLTLEARTHLDRLVDAFRRE